MRWDDIAWEPAAATVRGHVTSVHGKPITQEVTKTAAGMRTVPLVVQATKALKAQRAMIATKRLAAGRDALTRPLVFPAVNGGTWDPDSVSQIFKRLVTKAGVPTWPFHALRHTSASLLLSAGIAPEQCAKIMGHASIATFYSIYADLLQPAAQDAARKLERYLEHIAGASAEVAATGPMSANVSAKSAKAPAKTSGSKVIRR